MGLILVDGLETFFSSTPTHDAAPLAMRKGQCQPGIDVPQNRAQQEMTMQSDNHAVIQKMLNKVPEITLYFWIIKIMATTVGETAADDAFHQRGAIRVCCLTRQCS